MKHNQSLAKKVELFLLMRDLKDKLFGEFKSAGGQQQRFKAWQDVRVKAEALGLCKSTATNHQFQKNCFNNTVQRTRDKLNKRSKTDQGLSADVVLDELDGIVLDVIGRDAEREMVSVPGGRTFADWGRLSDDEKDPGQVTTASSASSPVSVADMEVFFAAGRESPSASPVSASPVSPAPPKSSESSPGGSSSAALTAGSSRMVAPATVATPTPVRAVSSTPLSGRRRDSGDSPTGSRVNRHAVTARYRALMAMADEELTDEERARVRQILVVRVLRRLAATEDLSPRDIDKLTALM